MIDEVQHKQIEQIFNKYYTTYPEELLNSGYSRFEFMVDITSAMYRWSKVTSNNQRDFLKLDLDSQLSILDNLVG